MFYVECIVFQEQTYCVAITVRTVAYLLDSVTYNLLLITYKPHPCQLPVKKLITPGYYKK